MEQNIEPKMEQNIEPNIEPKSKKYLIVLMIGVAVILVGLGIWYWQVQKEKNVAPPEIIPTAPATAPLNFQEDSTSAINKELDNIDVGDLDKEFQAIDTDLNSL